MAKQVIDIGSGELTGDGETLRQAFNKVNSNFTELYDDDANDITLASFSATTNAASGTGTLAYDNTSGVFSYTPPVTDVASDTTPQLGGNLDMNGFEIVTTNGGHIRLDPDTTGGVGIGNVTNAATLLHLQQSAPIITLQRTNNALSQGVSWTGQNGVEAASIKLDGTGGTTNTLIMSAFDGSSVTERLRVMSDTGKGIKVTGTIESDGVLKLLTTQGNDNIQLETNGTGNVLLKGDKVGIGIVNQPDTTLHLKDTNSVITLQRTADANTPGLSFQNSNGNVRAELKIDGVNGTSNEVFIKTDNQDGQGLVERLRVGHTGVTIAGTLNGHTIPAGTGTMALTSDIATQVNALVDSAPGTMDTLNELAAALGDDPNFATTVTTSIAEKLPLAGGTMAGAIAMGTAKITGLGTPTAGTDAATKAYVDSNSGSGITDVVEDTTPQLGGDLDVGGNSIVSTSSGPINIAPDGTGKISLSGVTQLGGNIEGQTYDITTTGKILYSNVYSNLVDLPSASTYHGMFAHVHATGKGYFAHGGNWVELANMSDVSSGGLANVVEDTTPQLGGDLDCQGFNITMDNGIISTSAGNLQLSSFNYVTIDSANNGQIEIGRSSGLGDVIIGKESNGTSVSFEGVASFDERALLYKGAEEKYSVLTGATGTVAHDCANGKMFHHTTPAADFTANFTNLDLNQYKFSTSIGIVITQGNTAYIPNAVQIAGAAQTIIWQGNSTPTGTDNGTDAISFTIMRDGSTYIVLGQLTSFGGV